MFDNLNLERKSVAGRLPDTWARKSEKQIKLEKQGCAFSGQELLDNHELDSEKKCYCGRPNKAT